MKKKTNPLFFSFLAMLITSVNTHNDWIRIGSLVIAGSSLFLIYKEKKNQQLLIKLIIGNQAFDQ